jgi:hypothetical protein
LGKVVPVIVRGVVVESEKPPVIVKVVVKLLGRPSRILRCGEGIGIGGFVRREIAGFAISTGVPEVLRPGIVVRRFVGRLVVIRGSVPTHAGPLLGVGGACNV